MKSLHARMVMLLLVAIVTVVALATFAASQAMRPPPTEATVEPVAKQLHLQLGLVEKSREDAIAAGVILQTERAPGPVYTNSTALLIEALKTTGSERIAVVTRERGSRIFKASIDLGADGWLVAEVPELSPPIFRWPLLTGWITLIIIGSAIVSILAATKIVRPLRMLEDAVAKIGADGILPYIPETGSGEIRATAQALNRMSVRLKSATESRMRLVAAAGHDLRTPMTRMRLRAEFISDEEERGKWFADLEELDQIADSAIRLVREEASQDGHETIRLGHLVHDIVDELFQQGHKVKAPPLLSLPVVAGPIALKRALRNLIINAATHGKSAKVELALKDDSAVITISDEGPGIPEHLLGQVFEPFFRVNIARRKTIPGAGLGLAIAKEIIERFSGTIKVENREPKGLLQVVTLPLARSG